jgi:hypothetical protein
MRTSENSVKAKFTAIAHLSHSPGPEGLPCRRGHNTSSVYYQNLMYAGVRISDALHKKFCRIEPGLCGSSENSNSTHSGE